MSKLKTYNEFVNEALIDAIKNPIKWKKIKNNAKKFQKAKVAQALNDIDYEKKKAASGSKDSDKNAILKAANAKKNDTLKQDTSDIGSRMDDLATTPGLKKVVTLAKSKSSLAANKIIIKAATGEEAKQLKVQQKKLVKKIGAAKTALADYESTDKKEEPAKKAAPPKVDNADTTKKEDNKDIEDKANKAADKEIADAKDAGNKSKEERKDSVSAKLEADIKAYNKSIEDERASMTKSMKDLDAAKRDQKLGRVSDEQVQAIMKKIEDSKEDIAELKKKEAEAKKKLSTKSESLVEGMYTAGQLTDMLLDDIRKGTRKGIHTPDAKELKTLALKRLKMKRVAKVDIEDTINGWEASLADARKDKRREDMLGKIPESFEYVAESVSDKFARLRSNL